MKKQVIIILIIAVSSIIRTFANNPIYVIIAPIAPNCGADTTVIAASASGGCGGPYTYLWMPGSLTGSFVNVTIAATTTYTLTVSDAASDTTIDSITVVINPMPIVHFSQSATSICIPDCISFTDSSTISSGSIAFSYWIFSDDASDTILVHNPTHCYFNSGTYSVRLTAISNAGCRSSLLKNNLIRVHPKPDADFSFTLSLPYTVNFINSSTMATSWHWNFGNGDTSILQNPPPITYTSPDNYTITLTVTNPFGCSDTAFHQILLTDIATISNSKNTILIAPNPFISKTIITFSEEQKNTLIKVVNVLGEEMFQSSINDKQFSVDMTGFARGIYFVYILKDTGIEVKKLIKQ